jgi:hypothetical protein
VPIVGDSKAYVFLCKHGPLIEQLPNGAVLLTLGGRVFVLTLLLYHGYLAKYMFNILAERDTRMEVMSPNSPFVGPQSAAYDTGKMLRTACEQWLANNKKQLYEQPTAIAYPTDLTFAQIALLLETLVAGQEDLERVAEGRKVQ